MEKLYKLRFRHLDGDVGPLQFQEATSVQGMKRMIWEEWPTEGEIANKVRSWRSPWTVLASGWACCTRGGEEGVSSWPNARPGGCTARRSAASGAARSGVGAGVQRPCRQAREPLAGIQQ